MAGANVSPIGVINQITSNLSDRYENGFPVQKKIIQNSDDANADSFLVAIDFANNNQTYLLKDDELMFKLASIYDAMPKSKDVLLESAFELNIETYFVKGEQLLSEEIGTLGTEYRLPTFELFAAFVPM